MQLLRRKNVIQVEWVNQWNDNEGTEMKCCHLSSSGWAQKPLSGRVDGLFNTRTRGMERQRVSEKPGSCVRPQSFLKQAHRILLEVSYLQVLQTQIGNGGDAWNETVVIWQKCSHAWVESRKSKSDNVRAVGGEQNYRLWAPRAPVVP